MVRTPHLTFFWLPNFREKIFTAPLTTIAASNFAKATTIIVFAVYTTTCSLFSF